MCVKNLCITILMLSNAAILFILFQNRDGIAISRQLNYMYSLEGSEKAEHARASKEYILKHYADAIASCGAVVSLAPVSSFAGTSELDMACLIAGKRDVIWGTLKIVKESLLNNIEVFTAAVQSERIREFEGISFRPEGERKALLLVKHRLHQELQRNVNPYLTGLLLGYDERDIEFFYQRLDFMSRPGDDNEVPPFSYAKFSDEQKRAFQDYLKNEWITSGDRDRFEQGKQNAFKWLAEQEVYSIDELYKQIAELKHKQTLLHPA